MISEATTIRDLAVAAPLKLGDADEVLAGVGPIRDLAVAAPLKQPESIGGHSPKGGYPRPRGRGPH